MAPKSLPHKITVPGLNALFGGREAEKTAAQPFAVEPPAVPAPKPVPPSEPLALVGEGSASSVPAIPPAASPAISAPVPAPAPAPATNPAKSAPIRKMSKGVRITQPEVEGKPKGRHTLVIDEMVLEELSLLAWAENMSVSAIAREAFDAYLGSRKKAVLQARELRESFGRKREAV